MILMGFWLIFVMNYRNSGAIPTIKMKNRDLSVESVLAVWYHTKMERHEHDAQGFVCGWIWFIFLICIPLAFMFGAPHEHFEREFVSASTLYLALSTCIAIGILILVILLKDFHDKDNERDDDKGIFFETGVSETIHRFQDNGIYLMITGSVLLLATSAFQIAPLFIYIHCVGYPLFNIKVAMVVLIWIFVVMEMVLMHCLFGTPRQSNSWWHFTGLFLLRFTLIPMKYVEKKRCRKKLRSKIRNYMMLATLLWSNFSLILYAMFENAKSVLDVEPTKEVNCSLGFVSVINQDDSIKFFNNMYISVLSEFTALMIGIIYQVFWLSMSKENEFNLQTKQSLESAKVAPQLHLEVYDEKSKLVESRNTDECHLSHHRPGPGLITLILTAITTVSFFVASEIALMVFCYHEQRNTHQSSEHRASLLLQLDGTAEILIYAFLLFTVCYIWFRMKDSLSNPTHETCITDLDQNLLLLSLSGIFLQNACSLIAAVYSIVDSTTRYAAFVVLIRDCIIILQSTAQTMFLCKLVRIDKFHFSNELKTILLVLLVYNLILYIFNLMVESKELCIEELEVSFYDAGDWGALLRVVSPFFIFYRFQSFVIIAAVIQRHVYLFNTPIEMPYKNLSSDSMIKMEGHNDARTN
ncbi:uncharacterized protein LOC117105115 isoform X1 [Anneissia japonica]|uniref:uncharacterized protein LOC117105115 isoform X1 n=1 Tax=Anneissia japonica TaxID=1529436 RepID=UPI00142561C4|nr:uncharacterized protein LOC117105115 isoform X1 [Anneissia japonica]